MALDNKNSANNKYAHNDQNSSQLMNIFFFIYLFFFASNFFVAASRIRVFNSHHTHIRILNGQTVCRSVSFVISISIKRSLGWVCLGWFCSVCAEELPLCRNCFFRRSLNFKVRGVRVSRLFVLHKLFFWQ